MKLTVDEVKVNALIKRLKHMSRHSVNIKKYNKALAAVAACAYVLYEYNQQYTDDELEEILLEVSKIIIKPSKEKIVDEKCSRKKKTVLFYDGFGLDTRGTALMYNKALAQNDYHIVYVTTKSAIGNQPIMQQVLMNYDIEWVYINTEKNHMTWCKDLSEQFEKFCPDVAFFYTTPYDVAGTVVFNGYRDLVYRYQIDLTDHAFWLGKNAFDLCIGSRNLSASIAYYYRGIPRKKLVMLDVNLYINQDEEFAGLPFNLNRHRFIFSGGALYKTLGDSENKYYKIVDYVLENHEDIVFVYAGYGDTTQLKLLQKKYCNRVYYLPERKDFYQIIEKCVFYLNTYPMFGGLMMRYAANAGKLPITLKHDNDADGILINQNKLGIEYNTYEELIDDVDRLLRDEKHLKEREARLAGSVLSEECFSKNVRKLIEERTTEFDYEIEKIDTSKFIAEYRARFEYSTVAINAIVKNVNSSLFMEFPVWFLKRISKLGIKFLYKLMQKGEKVL